MCTFFMPVSKKLDRKNNFIYPLDSLFLRGIIIPPRDTKGFAEAKKVEENRI